MNKQELIGHVADRAGLNRNDAMRAVETMLEVITSTLKRGDEVRLVGFGNFSVTRRKASTGATRGPASRCRSRRPRSPSSVPARCSRTRFSKSARSLSGTGEHWLPFGWTVGGRLYALLRLGMGA